MKLKGDVKSILETVYEVQRKSDIIEKGDIDPFSTIIHTIFDNKGYKIEENKHKTSNNILFRTTYKYDSKRNLTEKLIEENLHKNIFIINMWHSYMYDNKGNLIEESIYEYDSTLREKNTYKYDKKGNRIEHYKSSNKKRGSKLQEAHSAIQNWKVTYTYDINGNKIEENAIETTDNISTKKTYKYDKKGNIVEFLSKLNNNTISKSIFKHDKKGNLIEWKIFNTNGSLEYKLTYKYDKENNLVESNEYSSEGSGLKKIGILKFENDKHGNWIQQIKYKNKTPFQITERIIEYF